MEQYAYLNDVPHGFEMKRDDTIVIGKKVTVDGQDRYIAETVDAAHLVDAMTETVLTEADLPSHLQQMEKKVEQAQEHANQSGESAAASGQFKEQAAQSATTASQHADRSGQHEQNSAQLKMQCEQHEQTSESHAGTAGRHAESASQSEAKAQEFTEICEGFAGGLVSVLTMSIDNYTRTAKLDGLA